MKVKINNKTYTVAELKMEDYLKMEEQGISILEAFQKRQTMLVAMAFTCVVTGLERDDAAELLNQHVLGGGTFWTLLLPSIRLFLNLIFSRECSAQIRKPRRKRRNRKWRTSRFWRANPNKKFYTGSAGNIPPDSYKVQYSVF